jgi:hypothetical protein
MFGETRVRSSAMSSDGGDIRSRADFDRALKEARRIAFSEQCERFADPEWKSILKQLDTMKRCTAAGRAPEYGERLGIDLLISAKRAPYAQTIDRDDIGKKLLRLENYFKNWPENAPPDKAEPREPTQGEGVAGAAANHAAGGTLKPREDNRRPAKDSAGAERNKSKSSGDRKRFLLSNARSAAVAPLLVACAVYWTFHRIAPKNILLAKIAVVLLAASLGWLALFTLYAFYDFLRGFFVFCPRCHRRLSAPGRCRSCGLPRTKMGD